MSGIDLSGKTAIVTGASSGIGASTVRNVREVGRQVAGGARRVERIGAGAPLELDVTDEASSAALVEAAVEVDLDEIVIEALAQSSGAHLVRRPG